MSKKTKKKMRKSQTIYGPVVGALRLAIESIEPYEADARVAALARDLRGKLAAWDQHEGQLADVLVTAAVARAKAQVPNDDLLTRESLSKSGRFAQGEYLRSMSPAAADAYEAGRAA